MKRLRILVVDDKEKNLQAAREQLGGDHDLTCCSSFSDGCPRMREPEPENLARLLKEAGITSSEDPRYYWIWIDAYRKTPICLFDVVLTDMMAPMSDVRIAKEFYDPNREVPYGFFVLWEALRSGVEYVAMVTGSDPHVDPLSAVFPSGFVRLGDVKIVLAQQEDCLRKERKNWVRVLAKLLEE